MSRIVVVIFLGLLVACGLFLYTQLDTIQRVVEPNQRAALKAKRELADTFVAALRTGETGYVEHVLATDDDVARLIEDSGPAMKAAIGRAEPGSVVASVLALRKRTGANLAWEHIRLDERDESQLVYLAPKGAPLGKVVLRVRCGRSVHDLEIRDCVRAPRGWVVFGGVVYAQLVRGEGCDAPAPAGVTLTFAIEFGDTPATERAARTAEMLSGVRGRLRALGYGQAFPRLVNGTSIAFDLPALDQAQQHRVLGMIQREGSLRLCTEVLPDDEYARRMQQYRDPPKITRHSVWPGDETAFDEFKQGEIERWQRDRDAYEPSDPRFRLVKRRDAAGTAPGDFHVVEAQGFDSYTLLENAVVSEDELGRPVVVFDVRKEQQDAFARYTTANIGLPMALIFEGEYQTAPIIMDTLRRNVQITLGDGGSRAEQRAEAEDLALLLGAPPLPLPLRLEAIQRNTAGRK